MTSHKSFVICNLSFRPAISENVVWFDTHNASRDTHNASQDTHSSSHDTYNSSHDIS